MAIAVTGGRAEFCSGKTEPSGRTGALNGQVGFIISNRRVVPAESATVYVLYSRRMEDRAAWFEGKPTFWHGNNLDTAGGQFRERFNGLLAGNKELKSLEKRVRHNPQPEDVNQMGAYYLRSVDEALTWVHSYLTKHPDRGWEMKTVTPDGRGFWSAEGLAPGGYDVVVRGKLLQYDTDWEGEVDLPPDTTISLPLTRPRFLSHE